jgi:hypothetical protein
MPATLPGFRIHGPTTQPAERDPADDAFAPLVRDGCERCHEPTYDDRLLCEICRYGVTQEIRDE